MRPQVEAWSHGVRTLVIISKRNLQSGYTVLGMLLHLECQYLQITVPGVGTIMVSIEEALRKTFFPSFLLGEGGGVNADFCKTLGHSIKCGGLGIRDTQLSVDSSHRAFKAAFGEHIDHRLCIHGESAGVIKEG